jgi:hypothetical protein
MLRGKNLTWWPWKSTGFQIPLRTKYVPSLVKIHWRMLILECSQGCYRRTDGSVTISLRNFVGEGIKNQLWFDITQWIGENASMIIINKKSNVHLWLTSCYHLTMFQNLNCNGGVMVNVLTSWTVECELEPWSGQTKAYKIGISCFPAKHATLRSKSKDWLARNQNSVFKWSDMSTHRLLS